MAISDLARWHADSLLKHPGRSARYAEKICVYLRRDSKLARLTLFEGAHQGNYDAGVDFLARQEKGRDPDWTIPADGKSAEASTIAK